jgi:hypothetical protein
LPLQPSSSPARLPSVGQVGVQTHAPPTQAPLVPHPCAPQSQVSMQVPLLQTLPAAHCTLAHRFATHWPPLQTWSLEQVTPAHGLADTQVRLQACPEPQLASQASSGVHLPVPGLQYCPDGQLTPLHG